MSKNGSQPIMKTRWLSIAMLVLLPWLTACANDTQPFKPPLSFPFEVQKSGSKIETELRIVEGNVYRFALSLMYKKGDQADHERVRKLAGRYEKDKNGKLIEPGVPILLRLRINVIDASGERPMFEQEISELRVTSDGPDSFNKRIIDLTLKPGHYRVSIESLKNVPELLGTPIIFKIFIPFYK